MQLVAAYHRGELAIVEVTLNPGDLELLEERRAFVQERVPSIRPGGEGLSPRKLTVYVYCREEAYSECPLDNAVLIEVPLLDWWSRQPIREGFDDE